MVMILFVGGMAVNHNGHGGDARTMQE